MSSIQTEPSVSQAFAIPRTPPELLGIDSNALLAFLNAVEEKPGGMHSLMLLRHGLVAAEGWWSPYGPSHPHMLFSLSKSFTSTAVGLAVSEGLLSVEDRVVSFFPEELPPTIDNNLAVMRVKHLLTMATGHDLDTTGRTRSQPDGDWVRGFLALPVEHAPGSKFVYNSGATYMLSAIVQKLTGMRVIDYLTPRLFAPLGIEGAAWETCPKGIDTGGWGLSIKTEDIARFGQLYLQKGYWNGLQIVPETWVAEATIGHVSNGDPAAASDWSQGYGYQFWRCRHDAYRGDGAFGQFCVVLPDLDVVLAITAGTGNMQGILNAVWEHLLPGIHTAPLPSHKATKTLADVLANLKIPLPEGEQTSPCASEFSGKTYHFEPNDQKIESLSFEVDHDRCRVTLRPGLGSQSFEYGTKDWINGEVSLAGLPSNLVAGRGVWTAEERFTGMLCLFETPFIQTVTCIFDGDQVTFTLRQNVGFGPVEHAPLIGHSV